MNNQFTNRCKHEIYRLLRLIIVLCLLPSVLLALVVAFPVYLYVRRLQNHRRCVTKKREMLAARQRERSPVVG